LTFSNDINNNRRTLCEKAGILLFSDRILLSVERFSIFIGIDQSYLWNFFRNHSIEPDNLSYQQLQDVFLQNNILSYRLSFKAFLYPSTSNFQALISDLRHSLVPSMYNSIDISMNDVYSPRLSIKTADTISIEPYTGNFIADVLNSLPYSETAKKSWILRKEF